ncbi:MAG: hypothetical protein A3J59_01085 [Candidatus Buchananbacteria bacterium RIFCSPHIGHO2_02_FULL_56_16]|uniref:Uncharacterized protein n=1 Tax=Candidatus Buchananbacteria bacterium RIFCSPHIGHO2_02_FULL_56_16 TaxID=1797542 RepID=A0A1G1YIN6_9BACT|nr:MAG: hypothetical protein A3J59_01085 [Candidatus Buchananbacteria bacterium RIFCSPHIGHO2_02_FULL_56_16]
MAIDEATVSQELLAPNEGVAAILARHPPGWIGTIYEDGRFIAICLKEAWREPPARLSQVVMRGIGGQNYATDPFYFFVVDD